MYYYIIPFLVYIFTIPLINYGYLLVLRVAVLLILLLSFKKFYKLKLRIDLISIFIGLVIFLFWVLLEGHYPLIGASSSSFAPPNSVLLFFRAFSFIIIAPIIEEFFTRNFLARILVRNEWQKVKLGVFTTTSFIFTTLFFGFSHNRWLPGLIAGAALNYLIYKKRDMNSVVIAHATANTLLAIYIFLTNSWFFW